MTEEQWLANTNPRNLLSALRGRMSERKRRLFACACCRKARHLIDARSWEAVLLAERYADGLVSAVELDAAAEVANQIYLDTADRVRCRAAEAAYQCAVLGSDELYLLDCAWADAALALEGEELRRTSTLTPEDTEQMLDTWEEACCGSGEPMGWTAADATPEMADLFRDIFGNPFRSVKFSPEWRTDTAVGLARTMYESRNFSAMPILADALQDAGCDSDNILSHCRDPHGLHVRGCWVVDLVLGKQ